MANFVVTTYSTTPRTLTGGESGLVLGPSGVLDVSGDAVVASGATRNYLLVTGVITANANSPTNTISASGFAFEMDVGQTGLIANASDTAINALVTFSFQVHNEGSIQSHGTGIYGRRSDEGAYMLLSNTGVIQADGDAVSLDSGDATTSIVNSGRIISTLQTAIYANSFGDGGSTGPAVLVNTGTIAGGTHSYKAGNGLGVNTILNSGVMSGDIELGANNDRYDGAAGSVLGVVYGQGDNDSLSGGAQTDVFDGGDGNDQLVGRGGDDDLRGGTGTDFLLGGAGNDSLTGGDDSDTLNGNAGDDTLLGDLGNDLLVGQDGSDSMDGGTGNDTMDGGDGDDILEGGEGNDILRGRNGEDDLAGGTGMDLLTGGQGADNFVFRSTADAGIGATRDQILDFEKGIDTIVVAGLSPGVFEFRGTAAFAPSGNPELRLFETVTGSTIVQIDNNGDGGIDAEIRVANVTGLTAEDFVL